MLQRQLLGKSSWTYSNPFIKKPAVGHLIIVSFLFWVTSSKCINILLVGKNIFYNYNCIENFDFYYIFLCFFSPDLNQLQAARGGKRGVNMNPSVLLICVCIRGLLAVLVQVF
jgi:hypothetical protein